MTPDQGDRPDVGYTDEGRGVVARCTGCGWEVWKSDRSAAWAATRDDHPKCRKEDVAFEQRRRASTRGSVRR